MRSLVADISDGKTRPAIKPEERLLLAVVESAFWDLQSPDIARFFQRMNRRKLKGLNFARHKMDAATRSMPLHFLKQLTEHTSIVLTRADQIFYNGYWFSNDFRIPWGIAVKHKSIDAVLRIRCERS